MSKSSCALRIDPDLLRTQQIRSSFAHLPLTLSVSALNSTLLGAVLLNQTWRTTIIVWIGVQLGLSVVRIALWYAHRRMDTAPKSTTRWEYVATGGAFLSGLAWGYAPLLTEINDPRLLFVAVILCGMCAGAATVHAAHSATMLAFVVPAIVPLIIVFFLRDQAAFGLLACVFAISMVIASRKFRHWFREVTSAQLELTERTKELDSVNRRLRQEIADHQSTQEKLYQVAGAASALRRLYEANAREGAGAEAWSAAQFGATKASVPPPPLRPEPPAPRPIPPAGASSPPLP